MLIRKFGDQIHISVFELSPRNDAAMGTIGRLRRLFPAATVAIKLHEFENEQFQHTLAETLSTMSSCAVAGMQPKAKKAGQLHDEDRDTTHPGMVTEVLMAFLSAIGQPIPNTSITKNTREEVRWKDSRSPWHRSATWLLIRVALQITLAQSPGSSALYKQALLVTMCRIAEHALASPLSCDGLYVMNAKIAQRVLKLGSNINAAVLSHVQITTKDVHSELEKRWAIIREHDSEKLDLSGLMTLDFRQDTFASLSKLDEYLEAITKGQDKTQIAEGIESPSLLKFDPDTLPSLTDYGFSAEETYTLANLHGFEDWVASHCQLWSASRPASSRLDSIKGVSNLIKRYHSMASHYYTDNPEALSVMLLTIMELWIACDHLAKSSIPLLRAYDPEIDLDLLQNLLLPFKSQMNRLYSVEDYLRRRRSQTTKTQSELFCEMGTSDCFAVQYFNRCSEQQATRDEILVSATRARQAKKDELRQLQMEYNRLIDHCNSITCDEYDDVVDWINNFTVKRHRQDCNKCRYRAEAERMSIEVHEWPLPGDELKAKIIIFELRVPPAFAFWRESTLYIIMNVLGAEHFASVPPSTFKFLESDPHLKSYLIAPSNYDRCTLLSATKAHIGTHRKIKQASMVTEDDVCLENGLQYHYYDTQASAFLTEFAPTDKVVNVCAYGFPNCSSALRKYIWRPASAMDGPPPNTVIADQADCPSHMSLEEYKDLSTVPLGHRIQFHNLLMQLRAPTIDFRKVETALVMFQCLYQAGPPGNNSGPLRESHNAVQEDPLAPHIIDSVKVALGRIKANWESAQSLSIFSTVISRLLSLNQSQSVQQRCIETLWEMRRVAFGWVEELRNRVQNAESADDRTELQAKCVDVALICALSFDVDRSVLMEMLSSVENPENASILIQCSIIIQEAKKTYSRHSEPVLFLLEHRYRKLMRSCCSTLCQTIVGLDDAIKKAWPAFQTSSGWVPLDGLEDHWVVTKSRSAGFGSALTVHYNTLTGELLVNGVPLDRPPKEYEAHPQWKQLFGRSAIQVMPTVVPGMQFSLKQRFKSYEVHVGMGEASFGADLVVRAITDESIYTTVPSRLFEGHFPGFFVKNFVPWYNHRHRTIQFRPIGQPWNKDASEIWTMSDETTTSNWQLSRQGSAVVHLGSQTAQLIGEMLHALAESSSMQIVLNASSTAVEVEVPSLQMGFSLNAGSSSLQSREFRGMCIDENQSLATLCGLKSKLVLKSSITTQRMVLLAQGSVWYDRAGDHVKVFVNRSSMTKLHPLFIDRLLERLADNEDLQSKLFVAYIHALTSFCLPDPFTGRTGSEECLSILRSAAVRSFDQLSDSNVGILNKIAHLTPGRSFYPANETVMQSTTFSPSLSFLSQHNGFLDAVRAIFRQAEDASMFYPGSESLQLSSPRVNERLLRRDDIRSSTFRVSEFGAEDYKVTGDVEYKARDTDQSSEQARCAFLLSTIIYRNLSSRHGSILMPANLLWATGKIAETVVGARDATPCVFRFDPRLVASGLDFTQFLVLHRCAKLDTYSSPDKFNLMAWLAAQASFKDANMAVLQLLALMFTSPTVRDEDIPQVETCSLLAGYDLSKGQVSNLVQSNLLDISLSPEGPMKARKGESQLAFQARQRQIFSSNQTRVADIVVDRIWSQWPTRNPSMPDFSDQSIQPNRYIDITSAVQRAKTEFKMRVDNLQLFKYFSRLQNAVARLPARTITAPLWSTGTLTASTPRQRSISLDDVLGMIAPILPRNDVALPKYSSTQASAPSFSRLSGLVNDLHSLCDSQYEKAYVKELVDSLECLSKEAHFQNPDLTNTHTLGVLLDYRTQCQSRTDRLYSSVLSHIQQCSHDIHGAKVPHALTLWPRTSRMSLLRLLNRHHWPNLKEDWRRCIVELGLAISAAQRADRLVSAVRSPNKEDLVNEVLNSGHTNWSPYQYPESLLLEVESGILIRDVQEEIAATMRDPSSAHNYASTHNAVMQLNMGEGKSSVIVPMVATALADTSKLVRVVVGKPQSKQMLQMLVSKLGDLIDRRVRLMPFSRSLKLTTADANAVAHLVRDCMSRGDVLLVQPEQILSFQLMVLECFDTPTNHDIGRILLETQFFFDACSRDIVDESDENFSVKFELIYTMGTQRQIEFSPNRWLCIQEVLNLVKRFGPQVAKEYPGSVEVSPREDGGFPRIRIFNQEANDLLVELIATHICETGIAGFPIVRQVENVRSAVYRYLVKFEVTGNDIADVEDGDAASFWNTAAMRSALLLLRGLLAGGILAFVFGQKRWRVNYGLTSNRSPPTQLAVPYRAKDNPTPRSEFSHPDVVIVLTSLSYYYGGLTNEDLFTALKHLIGCDQAEVEYGAWIADAPNMPSEFCNIDGINLKDTLQCTMDIFPHLRIGKAAIDYFLANIVFPKAMKEFPLKLSASGWDLGKLKVQPSTGFSGTNDSKNLLPLDVKHLDLARQKHTNALVLDNVLNPHNSVLQLRDAGDNTKSEAERLLGIVIRQDPPVQVILDVGAQVLELDNHGLAKRWLEMHPNANNSIQAVVYVNNDDELSVLDRRGRPEPLQTSSYASRLDECLIFLDEAHTRGIDLKLPKHYRAAVTLGANLTKDRLVQGKSYPRKLLQAHLLTAI